MIHVAGAARRISQRPFARVAFRQRRGKANFNRAYRRAGQIVFDDRPRPTLKGLAFARLRHHATQRSARCLNSKFTKLDGKAEPEGKAETPEGWRPFFGDRVALRFSSSCARSSRAIPGFGAVH
jgi:hypothetical protein